MFDPRPLCCSSLTTAVGGTTDTNFVYSAHPTVARIKSNGILCNQEHPPCNQRGFYVPCHLLKQQRSFVFLSTFNYIFFSPSSSISPYFFGFWNCFERYCYLAVNAVMQQRMYFKVINKFSFSEILYAPACIVLMFPNPRLATRTYGI